MFIYEKNGKLNIEVNNKHQIPTTGTPDIVIEKPSTETVIKVDGNDIVNSAK